MQLYSAVIVTLSDISNPDIQSPISANYSSSSANSESRSSSWFEWHLHDQPKHLPELNLRRENLIMMATDDCLPLSLAVEATGRLGCAEGELWGEKIEGEEIMKE